jgi:hypothetical protein
MKSHSLHKSFAALCALIVLSFTAAQAHAYYDVLDNGEILPAGKYKATGSVQALTDSGGMNLGAMIDAGFQEEYGVRGLLGFGKTDYSLGGLFKWMPIPDVEGQPAIGFNTGLLYAKNGHARELTFRFEPLVSKRFPVGQSAWTPYASLPIGYRTRNFDDDSRKSQLAFQLVAGTQLQLEQWKNLQFMAEVGTDLDHALSHVSFAAVFYFDETGFSLQ